MMDDAWRPNPLVVPAPPAPPASAPVGGDGADGSGHAGDHAGGDVGDTGNGETPVEVGDESFEVESGTPPFLEVEFGEFPDSDGEDEMMAPFNTPAQLPEPDSEPAATAASEPELSISDMPPPPVPQRAELQQKRDALRARLEVVRRWVKNLENRIERNPTPRKVS